MKERVSLSLEKSLLEKIDDLLRKKFRGLPSRSSIIEYYLKKGMEDDVRALQEEQAIQKARVLR